MITFRVRVVQEVNVTVDEALFNEAFLAEFRESFYQFDTLEAHVQHLAQLYCRGMAGSFIEGYGKPEDMGIKFTCSETTDVEIV